MLSWLAPKYSECLTYDLLDFRQFSFIPFPDSLDFGHFLCEIRTLINLNGTKSLDFRQKKGSKIRAFVFGLWTLFYPHTSDNFIPSTYSVRLNVGASKPNQKGLPYLTHWCKKRLNGRIRPRRSNSTLFDTIFNPLI